MDTVNNLSSFDRRLVSVPKRCPGDCSMRKQCRYQLFLKQAMEREIDIQICNHNYLLTDAAHRNSGYRPLLKAYQLLVIDEAHELPETAQIRLELAAANSRLPENPDMEKVEAFVEYVNRRAIGGGITDGYYERIDSSKAAMDAQIEAKAPMGTQTEAKAAIQAQIAIKLAEI